MSKKGGNVSGKKRYRTLHFEFIACLLLVLSTVLYWISHYVDDFATNRTKRSTLNIKRWQLLLGGGSKQRPILNTTTTQYIRVSKKGRGGIHTAAVLWRYSGVTTFGRQLWIGFKMIGKYGIIL